MDSRFPYFSSKMLKKILIILVGITLCLAGSIAYTFFYGKIFYDRIVIASEDGKELLMGEFSRTQVFWPLYFHADTFYSYGIWDSALEESTFFWISPDIRSHGSLLELTSKVDFETTRSQVSLTFWEKSKFLFESDILNTEFVTKTDPEYFRFLSLGTGTVRINSWEKKAYVLYDTTISHDRTHAQLSSGTKTAGYVWGFWDANGNFTYFDTSTILIKSAKETYTPHTYLFSLSHDGYAKKEYTVDVGFSSTWLSLKNDKAQILDLPTKNIEKFPTMNNADVYYKLSWKNPQGIEIVGFFNAYTW